LSNVYGSGVFDTIVIVDWSARATPARGTDSIWVAAHDVATGSVRLTNPPTRATAIAQLMHEFAAPRRVLAGFDFSFGLPSGFAAAAGLRGDHPWQCLWEYLGREIVDDERNRNNRWQVAADLNRRLGSPHFWGTPAGRSGPHLPIRKPAPETTTLPEFRETELRLKAAGRHPFSGWQLLGAGSVGSQSLTGLAALQRLRTDPRLDSRVRVWPFETGFTEHPCDGRTDAIVLAEVWPSAIEFDHVPHAVKDARQVQALADAFAQLVRDGTLAGRFAPPLALDIAEKAAREEGWVLLV
jgi:precorrin-8X/cobalt-precorrin-8 methylmutase